MEEQTLQFKKELDKKSRELGLPIWLTAAAVAGVEFFLWSQMPFSVAVIGHVGVILVLMLLLVLYQRLGLDLRFIAALMFLVAFLGPFGAVAVLLVWPLYLILLPYSSPVHELMEALFPVLGNPRIEAVAREIRDKAAVIGGSGTPTPFVDIMTFGTVDQKRVVLGIVMRNFSPKLASILKIALRDENNSIRVMAATTQVFLEDQFSTTNLELREQVEKYPGNPEPLEKLASNCKLFAESGLLPEERAKELREEALACYRQYLVRAKFRFDIVLALAEVLVESGQLKEALLHLQEYLTQGGTVSGRLVGVYGRIFFLQRNYQKLRMLAKGRIGKKELDPEKMIKLCENLAVWGGELEAANEGQIKS